LSVYALKHISPTLVYYCDRRVGSGKGYQQVGFELVGTTSPNYYYVDGRLELMSRHRFQKQKLQQLLEFFDPSMSEWVNMKANGYDRVWDCGNLKYKLLLQS
jgi:hypothetical protein